MVRTSGANGRRRGKTWTAWYGDEINTSDWAAMSLPARLADEGLKDFYGSAWFRREVDVPAEYAGMPAIIRLGTIVDSDKVYINGIAVGETTYRYPPRKYSIPAGVIRSGRNNITMRVVSNAGEGEFVTDKPYRLEIGGKGFDLKGEWKYRIGAMLDHPLPPVVYVSYAPTGLYNGMTAPLQSLRIKGIVWYQGEANTPRAKEYESLLKCLIADWRKKWDDDRLPVLIVQRGIL